MPTNIAEHGIQRAEPEGPVIGDGDVMLATLFGREPHVVAALTNKRVADPTECHCQRPAIEVPRQSRQPSPPRSANHQLKYPDLTVAAIISLYSSVLDRPTSRSDWNSMTRTPPPTATVNSSRHSGLSSLAEPFQ